MAWHYDPPTPQTEADVTLAAYHQRLRAADRSDQFDQDVDEERPPAAGRLARLRNAILTKLARRRSRTTGAESS